jgi:hypothetical protein
MKVGQNLRLHAVEVQRRGAPARGRSSPDLDLVAARRLDLDYADRRAMALIRSSALRRTARSGEAGSLMAQCGIAHLAVTEPGTRRPIGVI